MAVPSSDDLLEITCIITIGSVDKHFIKEKGKVACGQLFGRQKESGFLIGYSCSNPGLIIANRNSDLRNALGQSLEHRIQSGVRYAERRALKQFQLRCALYEDGIAGERSNLLRLKVIAHRKHELHISLRCDGCHDCAEDIRQTILQYSH